MLDWVANRTRMLIAVTIVAAVQIAAGPADAGQLPQPSGAVVLTVTGDVPMANHGAAAEFDLEMLRALGMTTVRTTTIWTDGPQEFSGPPLAALMDLLGIEDGLLQARAANDYEIGIPVSDAVEGGPILAILQNGAPMSLRDKGPVWIIYPYDDSADYRTETIYARSIWQLEHIEVRR